MLSTKNPSTSFLSTNFLKIKTVYFSVFSSNEVLKPFYAWYDDDYFWKPETSSKRSHQGFFQGMGRSCFSCIIILDVFNTLYIVLVLKKVVKNPATSRILRKNPAGTGFLKYWRSGAGLSGVPEFRYTPMIFWLPQSQMKIKGTKIDISVIDY